MDDIIKDTNNNHMEVFEENENQTQGSEINRLEKERNEYLDGWQRARAELINYKKEEAKRFEAVSKYANEVMVRELIMVLDSFDLAILALEKNNNIDKGIYLIKTQLEDVLKNFGLEKVQVDIGQMFDPTIAEAVALIESDKDSGMVAEIVDKGYSLNGKIIKPARVKVAK